MTSSDALTLTNRFAGLTFKAEPFTGRKLARFHERAGWQVVAYKADGRRAAVFSGRRAGGRTPCKPLGWVARHYKSGICARDRVTYENFAREAAELAAEYNRIAALGSEGAQ